MPRTNETIGIVLTGGGARGAYEAGVAAGLVEVLGLGPADTAPFQVYAGTSVGAVNCAYLAAHAHHGDMGVSGMIEIWRRMRLASFVRPDALGVLELVAHLLPGYRRRHGGVGRSLLRVEPFAALIDGAIPWDTLHQNVLEKRVRAITVAALQVAEGTSTLFADLAPYVEFRHETDPRNVFVRTPIGLDHVLAAAAIPLAFPARRVGDTWYVDGALRLNAPIAPAIRSGADKLVVVSLQAQHEHLPPDVREANLRNYPSPFFLTGKMLNALLLDPMMYDLHILGRINDLHDNLKTHLDASTLSRVQSIIEQQRGLPYRRIDTLVFRPSTDIGQMAGERLDELTGHGLLDALIRWVRGSPPTLSGENDLASYLLFDGVFANRLIELGRRDVLARAAEVERFFSA